MTLIDTISNQGDQIINLVLDDGSVATFELFYRSAIQRYSFNIFHTSIPNGSANGIELGVHPNLLRYLRNIIPFGLACSTTDGADPFDINDFSNGRASLYLLNASDVGIVEQDFFGAAA